MGRPENEIIAALDDANAAQQLIRTHARKLTDELRLTPQIADRLEAIIRGTIRTQEYLKALREIERTK